MREEQRTKALSIDDSELIDAGLNLIQQGISIFNDEMKLVSFNRRFSEMFELPSDFLHLGISFYDINIYLARRGEYGPGDPDILAKERVERAKLFTAHYFERTRPNGRRVSVEGNPLGQGGWVTVYSDITESHRQEELLKARGEELSDRLLHHSGKMAEANRQLAASNRALRETQTALKASEERMRAITRAMPAHIAYLDTNYIYKFSNNRFADVTGLNRENLLDKSLADVYPLKVHAQIKPELDKALLGQSVVAEYDISTKTGRARSIRSSYTPEFDNHGDVAGVFVLSIDVSEEKAATELLMHSKRLETTAQLTSGLAHDFSNILTIILGNLSRIAKPEIQQTQRLDLIASTERAARRGTRIIDNLMTFLFRQQLSPTHTNLSKILRELARLFTASVNEHVTLKLDLPEQDILAFIDEGAFQDAILNLLFNARDAVEMHTGSGAITLCAKRASTTNDTNYDGVTVCVSDSGPGFAQDALNQAFEPFYTTKPQGKGSGLGLSMVRDFVDRSKGSISLQNIEKSGASVRLRIPLSFTELEDKTQSPQTLNNSPMTQRSEKIVLVVDDDPEIRALMRDYIAEEGFSVIEANSVDEAETLISNIDDIYLVVSDIIMPGTKTGVDLANQIAQVYPVIQILLVSGLPTNDPIIVSARKTFKILRKPFSKSNFTQTLINMIYDKGERL